MTKRTHTKRALLVSVLSMLLCLSMLVGSTFAWFTDSVTSGKNKIVAGNLDVELYAKVDGEYTQVDENTNLFMDNALWEPGHVEVVNLKVSNLGTLALKYNLGINVASETTGTNVFNETFKLSDYIQFAVIDGEQTYATRDAAIAAAKAANPVKLSELAYSKETVLMPGDSGNELVTLVVYMPTTVTNEANHLIETEAPQIVLGVNLVATQAMHEEDSFGQNYDQYAVYPGATVVETEDALKEAIATAEDGDVIALTDDMALTEPLTIDKDITINGDGKTISGKPMTVTADVKFENVVLSKPTNNNKTATPVYAYNGCENLTFEGVTFSDPQWEAIQITSKDLKTLTINNCTFTAANVDSSPDKGYGAAANELIRYIHYQPTAGLNPVVNFTITNNTFKNCDKITAQGAIVGMYYFGVDSTLTIGGNTFENWADGDVVDGVIQAKMAIRYPRIMDFMDLEKWTGAIQTYTPLPKTSTTSET